MHWIHLESGPISAVGSLTRRRTWVMMLLIVAMGTLTSSLAVVVNSSSATADTFQIGNDAGSDGWYPNQPLLTSSTVSPTSFGQTFDTTLDGAKIYAQPLVDQGQVLAVTEGDNAYGVNAASGATTWTANYGPAATPAVDPSNTGSSCGDIGPSLGITGTPVIDPATNIAYFVAARGTGPQRSWSGSTAPSTQYYLEAVNVATGLSPSGWPSGGVLITGNADNDPTTTFRGDFQTQRPGLVLVNGVVYAAFSSQCDFPPNIGTFTGWLVGVSTSTHSITSMWASETGGHNGGGIWQSGGAPVVDASGNIYVVTGNSFSTNLLPPVGSTGLESLANYGEAVVELSTTTGTLTPVDWFIPSGATALDLEDLDFSSGGPVELPASMGTPQQPNVLLGVGKNAILYSLDMAHLGGYEHGANASDAVPTELALSGGVWGRPAVWPGDGGYIYLPTTGSSGAQSSGTFNAYQRVVSASGAVGFQLAGTAASFGYSSGSPVVTSNAMTSGSALVWTIQSSGPSGAGGQLDAFNPIPGPSGTLTNVWHSPSFYATKYSSPGVGDGALFVGTEDGHLLGFGFVPATPSVTGTDVDFAPTVVSQTATANATFTATAGTSATTITSLSISGSGFALGEPSVTLPVTLQPGQSLIVPVDFTPAAIGTITGTLTASTSTGAAFNTTQVTLTGVGEAATLGVVASPSQVNFGNRPIGGATVSQTVTMTNDSGQAITVSGFVPPLPTSPFTISAPPNLGNLPANSSVSFTVTFTPPGTSGNYTHVFGSVATLQTSDGNFGVPISGGASPLAVLAFLPTSLDFGSVQVGTTVTKTFDIEDNGGVPLTISSSSPPLGANGFTATSTLAANTVIQPNASIRETVQFTPTTSGPLSDSWTISSNDSSSPTTLTLQGQGIVNVPAQPTIGSAVAANSQATVTWTPPVDDGGATISQFTATAIDGSNPANGGQTCVAAGAAATQCVVSGLTNGDQYTFTVAATNAAGTGRSSIASNVVTPTTIPPVPINVVATDHQNAESTVSWSAPSSDGGAAITGYVVWTFDAGTMQQSAQTCSATGASSTQCLVTGLVNGDSYFFKVVASNAVGAGLVSAASNVVTPQSPGLLALSSPTLALGGVPVGQSMSLSFLVQNKGGLPITITAVAPPRGSPFKASTTIAPGTVIGAQSSAQETVTFTPTTSGPASDTWTFQSNDGNPPLTVAISGLGDAVVTVPGAPSILSVAAGDARATVAWQSPASDGGAVVSSYRVSATDVTVHSRGGQNCTVAASLSHCVVTGLHNGDRYTFNVAATNMVGQGDLSTASVDVTPYSPVLRILSRHGRALTPLHLESAGGPPGLTIDYFVVNGSAEGCHITAGSLVSSTGGTCVVMAYKGAGSGAPAVSSGVSIISMSGPSIHLDQPLAIVSFAPGSRSLTFADKATLLKVARVLSSNVTLTVTGYATRDAKLAKARARAVASYFAHATVVVIFHSVSSAAANLATISTKS